MRNVWLPVRVVPAEEVSDGELEEASSDFRTALQEDAFEVQYGAARPSEQGRSGTPLIAAGTLLVSVLGQEAAIEHLIGRLRDWARQTRRYRVVVELPEGGIDVEASADEVRRLIDAWIRRTSKG